MRKSFEDDVCAFCNIDTKLNKVLFENDYWIAWEVPNALTTMKSTLALQIVFFPKSHVRHLNDLTSGERAGFWEVVDWAYKTYPIPGGAFFARVGDMRYNVGTVPHLHFNIFVPNREGEVIVYLQKSPKISAEHDTRMQGFASRYKTGEVPEET